MRLVLLRGARETSPKIALIAIVQSVVLAGCAGQEIPVYDYEKPSSRTDVGRFNLTFNPGLRQHQTSDGEVWEVAGPYRFNTQYLHPHDGAVRGRICDIRIRSIISDFEFVETGCLSDTMTMHGRKSAMEPKALVGFGIGDLDLPYEDILVRFDFEIEGIDGRVIDAGSIEQVVRRNPGTTILH